MKLPTEGRHTQPGWENGAQGTGGKVGASLQDELRKRVGGSLLACVVLRSQSLSYCSPRCLISDRSLSGSCPDHRLWARVSAGTSREGPDAGENADGTAATC